MNLSLAYELLPHPYPEDSVSTTELWAKINLTISDNGDLVKTVFDTQWDIIVLINWLIENEQALINDTVPKEIDNPSIAKGIFNFYNTLDVDNTDGKTIDAVFDYRTRHGIRFALKGTNVIDAYIGNAYGKYTISFYSEKDHWDYEINIIEFFESIHVLKSVIDQTLR